jgi:hypothetical protein
MSAWNGLSAGEEELLQTNLMALDAAFAGDAVKERCSTKLRHGYAVAASV